MSLTNHYILKTDKWFYQITQNSNRLLTIFFQEI